MKAEYVDRIGRLREKAIRPDISYDDFYLRFYTRFAAQGSGSMSFARYADAFMYAFAHARVDIDADELIVGRAVPLDADGQAEWESLKRGIVRETAVMEGQDSHMTVDLEEVLSIGTSGIREKIGLLAEQKPEAKAFYACADACLKAVEELSDRYADNAEEMAGKADSPRRGELLAIARACRRVPKNGATTFFEAVQAMHFICFVLSVDPLKPSSQQFQLGRPDRLLIGFYEKDIAEGRLTPEKAQLLIDMLALQVNRRVPRGLSSGWMVGGRDKYGNVTDNDVTHMCLQAIDDVRLVYPSVGLCCTTDTPDGTIQEACRILSHGRSHPALFNDDVIQEGLRLYGVPADEAADYIHSTCVEITPIASSNCWVASPYHNLPQLLLDALAGEVPDYGALEKRFFENLDREIALRVEEQERYRRLKKQKAIAPLLSCFVRDCLARGLDIQQGGARYNWIMPSFVGLANVADALYAIRYFVFDKKTVTMERLKAALAGDFADDEALRQMLLEKADKYGNDCDEVDEVFRRISEHIVRTCRGFTSSLPNGNIIPSVFCWVMHEALGRETGATPDGRHAGFPLGDGSGPCQGREKKGPTASILSSTKWSHKEMIGGVAVNMKFPKSTFSGPSLEKVVKLVRTYHARGGFELQINVVDRDTLLDAQLHPEAHQDLVVRIGGYSDYFVHLSPQMQAEVLLRTEHDI